MAIGGTAKIAIPIEFEGHVEDLQKKIQELLKLIKQMQKIEPEVSDAKVKEQGEKVKQTSGEVGAQAGKTAGQKWSEFFVKGMSIKMIADSITTIADAFNKFFESGRKTEEALARLSALTGIVGQELQRFKELGRELAFQYGTSTSEQLENFLGIVSRLGVEFGKNIPAVAGLANYVNILSKASGLDAVQSMDALTTALLQFRVPLNDTPKVLAEANRMINVMAEGAKQGSAFIPQVAEALKQVGAAASNAKLSFEEVNAAIQVMSRGGQFGAEAGTELRNVITRLQARLTSERHLIQDILDKMKVSGFDIAETLNTEGLSAALTKLRQGLQNLGSDTERNVALIRIFGEEGQTAASILMNNLDILNEWRFSLGGTNTAIEQANIMMNTQGAVIQRVTNAVKMMISSVFAKFPSWFKMFTGLTSQIAPLIQSLAGLNIVLQTGLVQGMVRFGSVMLANVVPATWTVVGANNVAVFSFRALATSIWSALAPIAPYILAIGALVALGAVLYSHFHKTNEEREKEVENNIKATQEQINYNAELKKQVENRDKLLELYEQTTSKQEKTREDLAQEGRLREKMIELYGAEFIEAEKQGKALDFLAQKRAENRKEVEEISGKIYQYKVEEIRMRTEQVKLETEVKSEDLAKKVRDAISDNEDAFKVELYGFDPNMADLQDAMKKVIDTMKNAKGLAELQEAYGKALSGADAIKDPKVKAEVKKGFAELYEQKKKEFERTEQEQIELMMADLERLGVELGKKKIKFGGIEFDTSKAEDLDRLAGELAKKYGITTDKAKELVLQQQKSAMLKEIEDAKNKSIVESARKEIDVQKAKVKYELMDLLYKQKAGQALTEEEKKRLEILKIQAKQLAMNSKMLDEVEKEVDALFGSEKKSAGVGKTLAQILQERLEKQKLELDIEKRKAELISLRMEKEDKEKFLKETDVKNANNLLDAYKEIYGVQVLTNEKGEVQFEWAKKTKLKQDERKKVEKEMLEVLIERSKAMQEETEKTKDQLENLKNLKNQIESVKLDVEIGDINKEQADARIKELYDELIKSSREKLKELQGQLSLLPATPGENKERENLEKQIEETKKILSDALNWERQEKEKQAKELLDIQKDRFDKELEQQKKFFDLERKLIEAESETTRKTMEMEITKRYDSELAKKKELLDRKVITDEAYARYEKDFEAKKQQELAMIDIVSNALRQETERQQQLKELELTRNQIEEKKRLLEEKGLTETEEYQKTLAELDKANAQYQEKADIMMAYSDTIQAGVEQMVLGIAEGNKEATKDAMKSVMGTLIGVLKKYAIMTITSIVLGQLHQLGITGGLATLLLEPAIHALVSAGINALLTPIIRQLSTFATGGRVDQPTMALIGEKETEWIVRDRDIERILMERFKVESQWLTKVLATEAVAESERWEKVFKTIEDNTRLQQIVSEKLRVEKISELREIEKQSKVEVRVETAEIQKEIAELRRTIEQWSGRVYVVDRDIENALEKREAIKVKLKSYK